MDEAQMELVIELSEGNPGALSVLAQLSQQPGGFDDILELKRQGVTGSLIWLRYSDVCHKDLDALRENIRVTALEHELPADAAS